MAQHYSVARGGNKRNFPWDSQLSSHNTAGNIRYTPHNAVRQFVLPMDFDGGHPDWKNFFKSEMQSGAPVAGDTFDWYFINEGTEIERIVIHNKRAVAGLTVEVRAYAYDGTPMTAPVTYNLGTAGFLGLGAPIRGTGPVSGAPGSETATVDVPVYAGIAHNGVVQLKIVAGDLSQACFTTFLTLTDYNSEKACSCEVVECDVEFPTPLCFNPTPQV